MVTSCAVEALCMAFGPIEAKETLPTRTFHATVRDWKSVLVTMGVKKKGVSHDGAQDVAFVRVLVLQAQVCKHRCFVLADGCAGYGDK
jgi:hypothetical protein